MSEVIRLQVDDSLRPYLGGRRDLIDRQSPFLSRLLKPSADCLNHPKRIFTDRTKCQPPKRWPRSMLDSATRASRSTRICLGLAPSPGPKMPLRSRMSTTLAARVYPRRKRRCNIDVEAFFSCRIISKQRLTSSSSSSVTSSSTEELDSSWL